MAIEKPASVIVTLNVNRKRSARLAELGAPVEMRDRNRQDVVDGRHVLDALERGRDPFRGNRSAADGTPRPDSGVPLFSWDPGGKQNVSFRRIARDLEANGFRVTGVRLIRRLAEKTDRFFITFSAGEAPASLGTRLLEAVEKELAEPVYKFVHGYRNPNKTVTLNGAHRLQPHEVVGQAYEIRVRPDWAIRNERTEVARSAS